MFNEIKNNVDLVIMDEQQYKEKFNNFDSLNTQQQEEICSIAENSLARDKILLAEWKEELAPEEYGLLVESFFEDMVLEKDTIKVYRYLTNAKFI